MFMGTITYKKINLDGLLLNMLCFLLLVCTKHCLGCKTKHSKADCSNMNLKGVPQNLDPYIKVLNLNRNQLRKLENKSFEKYMLLKELHINKNDQLSFIDEKAFYGLERLLILSLTDNNLSLDTAYPKHVFKPLSRLERLDLSNNDYSSVYNTKPTYYPYFGHLKNLKELDVDLVSIPRFNESGFEKTKHLTVVRFPSCELLHMTNASLQGITKSVKSIVMKRCDHILNVEANFLAVFPNLENISLYDSYITLLSALSLLYPFRDKHLKTIDFNRLVSKNKHSVIVTRRMMEYLKTICVENLFLTENGIVDFEKGSLLTYNHPECFRMIVFTGNRFSISSTSKAVELQSLFDNMTNLTVFDFSFNPLKFKDISYINPDKPYFNFETHLRDQQRQFAINRQTVNHSMAPNVSLSFPSKLKTLRISHFLGSFKGEISWIIKNADNLLYLDISYFQMVFIPNVFFDGPNNLKYVDFSGIDITLYFQKATGPQFDNATSVILQDSKLNFAISKISSIFRFIPNVENLDLSWNNLWYLPYDSFSNNMHIKKLILTGNSFHQMPIVITSLTDLFFLDMTSNNLNTINESLRTWFDEQRKKIKNFKLKLTGNAFQCACSTTGFIEWLFKTHVKVVNSSKLICSFKNGTKTNLTYVYAHFHELFKNCNSEIWLRIGIGCLVSFVVLIIPTAVLFNFRWQITYLIYRKFKRVIERNIKEKFKYDMYICYAEESVNWIKDVLVPKLENTWEMSLCISDRDILAGEMRSDAIAEAISQSRHVLIILSSGFKMGVWASYELDRIKYEKYSNKLQRIIIIARDVLAEDVPLELDNIWKDATIINWSDMEGETGWDKLRLNLFSEAI